MKEEIALITGCTSGIGLYLAHQFARHGHAVVLVAPDANELSILAAEIEGSYGVTAYTIAKDLEKPAAADEVYDELSQSGIEIHILANNAGHGFWGKFSDQPLEQDISMISLNIEAPVRMTKRFLPLMIARGAGRILNTSSVAGFEPGPLLNVYHSTKAFVLSFTEALSVELAGTGVSVTALCPGPTDTDFFTKAGMIEVTGFQKGNLMAPQDVARAAYEGLMNGDLHVIPGAANKALVQGRRLLTDRAQARLNEKMYEKVPPEKLTRRRGDKEAAAHI